MKFRVILGIFGLAMIMILIALYTWDNKPSGEHTPEVINKTEIVNGENFHNETTVKKNDAFGLRHEETRDSYAYGSTQYKAYFQEVRRLLIHQHGVGFINRIIDQLKNGPNKKNAIKLARDYELIDAIPELIKLLSDPDYSREAAAALVYFKHPKGYEFLSNNFENGSKSLQYLAVKAYTQNPPKNLDFKDFKSALNSDDAAASRYAALILAYQKEQSVLPVLLQIIPEKNAASVVLEAYAYLIGSDAVPLLKKQLLNSTEPDTQITSAKLLWKNGENAGRSYILDVIEKYKASPNRFLETYTDEGNLVSRSSNPDFEKWARESGVDTKTTRLAIEAIGTISDSANIQILVEAYNATKNNNTTVAEAALASLARLSNEEAYDALINLKQAIQDEHLDTYGKAIALFDTQTADEVVGEIFDHGSERVIVKKAEVFGWNGFFANNDIY